MLCKGLTISSAKDGPFFKALIGKKKMLAGEVITPKDFNRRRSGMWSVDAPCKESLLCRKQKKEEKYSTTSLGRIGWSHVQNSL